MLVLSGPIDQIGSYTLNLLEQLISGAPIVISNTPALPEVVGTATIFVHPDLTESVRNSIGLISSNRHFIGLK